MEFTTSGAEGSGGDQIIHQTDAIERNAVRDFTKTSADVSFAAAGGPVGDFRPGITPGVVAANLIGLRPLSGNSVVDFVEMSSLTDASSVLMGGISAVISTVVSTDPTFSEKSARAV